MQKYKTSTQDSFSRYLRHSTTNTLTKNESFIL